MAGPKYAEEFKVFSAGLMNKLGGDCYFCKATGPVHSFYLLLSKTHKQERLFTHPDKKEFYYPACQSCMQQYAKGRDAFVANLVLKGVSNLQVEQHLAQKVQSFLGLFVKGDVTSYKAWLEELAKNAEEVGYIPNHDNNPVVQLLPAIASKLTQSEIDFCINRIRSYQEDFLFNSSSDHMLLINIVLCEVELQRIMARKLTKQLNDKEKAAIGKEWVEAMKDYRETLSSLGILRKERDKIGGSNIAEISELIGDQDTMRLEVQTWDDELDDQLAAKKARDEDRGF